MELLDIASAINSGHELCNHPVSQSWDYSDRQHILLTLSYVESNEVRGAQGKKRAEVASNYRSLSTYYIYGERHTCTVFTGRF